MRQTARRSLSKLIREQQSEILDEWRREAGRLARARALDRPTFINHVPDLLARIADMVDELSDGGHPTLSTDVAALHAAERLEEGFDLGSVVAEFAILRDAILRIIERDVPVGPMPHLRVLHQAIDRAVFESVDKFTEARDRTLQSLDRIANAALEGTSLDDFLRRLLQVLVETTPAVHTAAILLREGESLRVRAAVGLDGEAESDFAVRIGEGFEGMIAAEGRPRCVDAACTDPTVRGPSLRKRGVRALYGVPISDGVQLIGVAHIGSLSAPHFSDQDKRLFAAMTFRASAAIYQHMLREAAAKRAEAEEKARAEAERALAVVDALLSSSLVGFGYLDTDLRYVRVNDALAAMNGRPAAEHVGRTLREIMGKHADGVEPALHRVLATSEPITDLEINAAPPSSPKRARSFLASYFPVRTPSGEVIGVGAAVVEVTELRAREVQCRMLAEVTSVLASSPDYRHSLRRMAELMVPALADWCVVDLLDRDGKMTRVATVHSEPSKVALATELARRHPPDPNAKAGSAKAMRTGVAELIEDVTDEVLATIATDPERLRVMRGLGIKSYIVAPMNARGRTLGAISIVAVESSNRYGQKDLEFLEELARRAAIAVDNAQLYEEAQHAVHMREEILGVVSHDLKNPLSAIQLAGAVLLGRSGGDPNTRKQIEVINRAAGRMDHLLGDLLDMASVQAGRLAIERQHEDAQSVIDEAVEMNEPAAREKGLAIVAGKGLRGVRAPIDRHRILQVLGNLLGNAIKFCRSGGVITIRGESTRHEAVISVADTGPGIPEADLPHVFEPYWSARVHAKKGTGLGLFISKGIVEAHGGRIWVDSPPGHGATFSFTLPLRAAGP